MTQSATQYRTGLASVLKTAIIIQAGCIMDNFEDDDCPVPLQIELNGKTIAWAIAACLGSLAVFYKVYWGFL